jgi:hypothetical protein
VCLVCVCIYFVCVCMCVQTEKISRHRTIPTERELFDFNIQHRIYKRPAKIIINFSIFGFAHQYYLK